MARTFYSFSADNMQAETPKQEFCVRLLVWQMVFRSQNYDTDVRVMRVCVCVCVISLLNSSLLLRNAIVVSRHAGIPSALHLYQCPNQIAILGSDSASLSKC